MFLPSIKKGAVSLASSKVPSTEVFKFAHITIPFRSLLARLKGRGAGPASKLPNSRPIGEALSLNCPGVPTLSGTRHTLTTIELVKGAISTAIICKG